MTIHKEGTGPLIIAIIVLFVINLMIRPFIMDYDILLYLLWAASVVMFLLILQFFRKPSRPKLENEGAVYSPCDGKVVVIEEVEEPEYFNGKRIQISIFMSPLNVHVNWAPIKGIVQYFKYHPGKYLVAWHPKSSTENERTTMVFKQGDREVLVRQIAGAVARRILWYTEEGKSFEQNEEIGFIRFGSRVDVFLPLGTEISVNIGDKVTGTQTQLARF